MRPIIRSASWLGYLVAARKLDVSYKMLPVLVENYYLTSLQSIWEIAGGAEVCCVWVRDQTGKQNLKMTCSHNAQKLHKICMKISNIATQFAQGSPMHLPEFLVTSE